MGQQQLLLLVLGIIIVGIAIVVGIATYTEKSVSTNWDILMQDAIIIATEAQEWKMKPSLFGGSPDSIRHDADNFSNVNFVDLSHTASDISGTSNQCFTSLDGIVELTPSATGLTITATNVAYQNMITVKLIGVTSADINISTTASEVVKGGEKTDGSGSQTVTVPACS